MPFVSRRAQLKLSGGEIEKLTALSQSRSQPAGRVQRASILLRYHTGETVSEIARALGTNRRLLTVSLRGLTTRSGQANQSNQAKRQSCD